MHAAGIDHRVKFEAFEPSHRCQASPEPRSHLLPSHTQEIACPGMPHRTCRATVSWILQKKALSISRPKTGSFRAVDATRRDTCGLRALLSHATHFTEAWQSPIL